MSKTGKYQDVELKDYEMVHFAKIWKEKFGNISAAFLQRKLNIRYNKAIEIIDFVNKSL